MIRIFDKNETDFSHDGLEVLDDITISCESDRQTNSVYFIEAEFIRDSDKSNSIKNGNILKVPTSSGKEQLFRIKKIKPKKNTLSIYARHIFFDNDDNFIEDTNIVSKDGRGAVSQLLGATQYNHRFKGASDISIMNNARIVRKNLTEALLSDDDNSFLSRWGGELDVDNFSFSINTRCGMDRGVEITYNHNMKEFEGDIDETGVITRIMPMAYNGIMLPEKYVDSPYIGVYGNPKIRKFEFSHIKLQEDVTGDDETGYQTLDELYVALREACNNLYEVENVDKPKINLTIDIIALEKTDQFKDELMFEKIFFGDTLKVNLAKYGFDVSVRVIGERYDCKRDRYIDIELGDPKENLFKELTNIQDTIDNVVGQLGGNSWSDILDKAMDEASQLIAEGIKGSYVVCRKNEILIMDSPEVESSINVIRMNKNGIAFSQNGYNGPYTLAITIDGKINASCIMTGELNAALIKTGLLQSSNGTTWINMETGEFNFADRVKLIDNEFSITLANGNTVEQEVSANNKHLNDRIDEVDNKIDNVLDDVGGALADGVISEAEASMIRIKLLDFEKEKAKIIEEYTKIYNNTDLSGSAKTNLLTAYNDYIGKCNDLITTINNIIADSEATQSEKDLYNAKVELYNASYATFSKRLQEALDFILSKKPNLATVQTEIKVTADGIKETISSVDGKVTEVTKSLDGFKVQTVNGGSGNLLKNGHIDKYYNVNQVVQTYPYDIDDDIKTIIRGQAITISFEAKGSVSNSTHASMFGVEMNITYSDGTTDWLNCSTSNNTQSPNLNSGTYYRWINNNITVQNKAISEVKIYSFARYFVGGIKLKDVCIQVGKTNGAYMLHKSSIIDGITTIDKNGVTVDSSNSDCITNINANGNKVTRKSDNKVLFEVSGGNLTMEGTLSTGTSGQRIEVSGSDYKVFNGSTTNAFFGYRNFENSYLVPKFYMGAYGFDMNTHNYFGITPYKGNADNPQGSTAAYVDLSYRSITHKDWSNIKMYSDGNVRVAPIQNFEITTNFLNGSYAGSEERRLAMFTTSSLDDYNSNLQIGVVANHSNSNGLVLADRYRDACWPGSGGSNNGSSWRTAVRIHTDSNNNKFFRPLNGNGDIELGSASFPWKKVTATSTYSSEGIVYNPVSTFSLEDNSNKSIIDRVKFVEPKTRALSTNEDITMDVTDILDTGLVEVSEEGQAFINNTAFTKLLLKESKRLKAENEMLIEKNNELMARLEVTQKALDELLLNIMEV